MNRHLLPLLALLFTGACVAWLSTTIPPSSQTVVVPQTPPERVKSALFYSDMGADTVDISAYPAERKRDYAVYAQVCSRCHNLARSINAPYVGRAWWEFYVARMRVRSRFHGEPLTRQEIRAIIDFLEYDSNERKVARAAEYEQIKLELKRRFEQALDERIELLQKKPLPHRTP